MSLPKTDKKNSATLNRMFYNQRVCVQMMMMMINSSSSTSDQCRCANYQLSDCLFSSRRSSQFSEQVTSGRCHLSLSFLVLGVTISSAVVCAVLVLQCSSKRSMSIRRSLITGGLVVCLGCSSSSLLLLLAAVK